VEATEQHQDLRIVLDTMPVMAWCALPDGSVEFFNRRWLDFSGLSAEGARDWGWTAAIHPEDLAHLMDIWRAVLGSAEPGEFEARLRRFDGEYRWFQFRAEPLRDKEGNVVKWYGANTDIEDLKRTREELRLYRELVEYTKTVVWRGDAQTFQFTFVSPQAEALLGYPVERWLKEPTFWIDHIHPEDRNWAPQFCARATAEMRAHEFDYRMIAADGRVIWFHDVVDILLENDRPKELVGVMFDVTEKKQAEEALLVTQSELARVTRVTMGGQLAASIAHEINQPLAAIVANGNAGLRWLSNETPEVEEARAVLKRIVSDGHRASELITSVRAMFVRGGHEKVPLDINDVIRVAINLVHGEMGPKAVKAQMDLLDGLPQVSGNRVQLLQVILNLMTNAVEAMGSVMDRARVLGVKSEIDGSRNILVTVHDSGMGIDANNLDRIFEPFFTTKSHGMGIGLSICRSIIEAHDGRLWVAPGNPYGSIFHVVLPAVRFGAE
jgi:PAS domain S-box-containing protein